MEEAFFYLRNPLAFKEISKHKWLESEKAGRDIGLTQAAEDWIVKYGQQWKSFYDSQYRDNCVFLERRQFRRFIWNNFIKIIDKEGLSFAKVVNLSFLGVSVSTVNNFVVGQRVRLHLSFAPKSQGSLMSIAIVERVVSLQNKEAKEIFFRFQDNNLPRIKENDFLKNLLCDRQ